MKTKFINATVLTMNEKFDILTNACVEIENNEIIYVGAFRNSNADKIIDVKNNLLMPGFVNTHAHAAMSLFKGVGCGTDFSQWWSNYMKPLEDKLIEGDCYVGVVLSCFEMIKNGITCFLDCYMNANETARAVEQMGMRAGICFGAITGKEKLSQDSLLNEFNALCKYETIKPFVYAHSVFSCDEFQFSELLRFAKQHHLSFTTHASETLDEVGECDKKHGLTPIALLNDYGMFEVNSILAHCTYGDKEDAKILNENNVTVATNPSSNLILGSGIAPLYTYLKNNINISLGTDSSASNNSLDIFKEMFLASTLSCGVLNKADAISAKDALKMATINGAIAMGYSNLGKVEEGYLADLIVINLKTANMQPENNLVANIVYSANAGNVMLTMVNGKVLFENGQFLVNENLDKIIDQANIIINRLKHE